MVATRRSSAAGSARVGFARGASRVPTEAKLVFAVAGIFFAFGAFAVLQEDVYRTSYAGERFSATFLVLIVERGVNTAVGAVGTVTLTATCAWRGLAMSGSSQNPSGSVHGGEGGSGRGSWVGGCSSG